MPQIQANGLNLEYALHGPETGETVLLIMGLGAQMTHWPAEMIQALAAKGYRVIAYDNRDIGLSQRFDHAGAPDMGGVIAALKSGQKPPLAYVLDDMADDAAGLLGALDIPRAHIVGASMGGMIAQMVAANHPNRTLSLTSIMSTTGNRALPPARPEAMVLLTGAPIDPAVDLEGHVAKGVKSNSIVGSPGYPADPEILAARVRADALRSYSPLGQARQSAAIVAAGDRRAALATITAPTVVIHGADDPLVPLEGGQDTAATIPGAELHVFPGMGHDIPQALIPQIVALIDRAASRARAEA